MLAERIILFHINTSFRTHRVMSKKMKSTTKSLTSDVKGKIASSFNTMAGQFLCKMIKTYPNSSGPLKSAYKKLLFAIKASKTFVIQIFIEEIKQFEQLVRTKDDKMFLDNNDQLGMFSGVDMAANWKSSPQETKDAIWSYMNTLLNISTSYKSIDFSLSSPSDGNEDDAEVDPSQLLTKETLAELMNSDMVKSAVESSQELLDEFKKKNGNREPTMNDDMSAASLELADKLGVDMSCLSELDLNSMESEIANVDLGAALGQKINKQQSKQVTGFVMKQLKQMKARQRLRSKLKSK